jgi:hypothetical protein
VTDVTELDDFWDQPIDWEAYRELAFALLDDDRGEVQCKDAETHPRPRSATETTAEAGQGEEA